MTVDVDTLRARLDRNADLLTKAQRERARAFAELGAARAEIHDLRLDLRDAQLDLAAAHELLAYHGHTPVEGTR